MDCVDDTESKFKFTDAQGNLQISNLNIYILVAHVYYICFS